MSDQVREAFEKWAIDKGLGIERHRDYPADYDRIQTQRAWEGYQAGRTDERCEGEKREQKIRDLLYSEELDGCVLSRVEQLLQRLRDSREQVAAVHKEVARIEARKRELRRIGHELLTEVHIANGHNGGNPAECLTEYCRRSQAALALPDTPSAKEAHG